MPLGPQNSVSVALRTPQAPAVPTPPVKKSAWRTHPEAQLGSRSSRTPDSVPMSTEAPGRLMSSCRMLGSGAGVLLGAPPKSTA